MLGVGEILAITSLVMQVVASVQKVIEIFEKAQNAPKELEQLRVSLIRMSRHFDMIRAKHESTGSSLIHKDDTDEIFDTLLCCKALFDDYERVRSRDGVLQAIWGNQKSDMVARYQLRIDRHFTQILLPLWVTASHSAAVVDSTVSDAHPIRRNSVVPSQQLDNLSEGLRQLEMVDSRDEIERTLQRLDRTLQTCWEDLGLPVDKTNNIILPQVIRRRSSFTIAPTTLQLKSAPEKHRRIRLQRVHVMAKDASSRILLYENKDSSIQVTQIIPFGYIPWTPSQKSTRVSFLKTFVVTIKDADGHHIYHIDPQYHFKTLDACNKFQETFRERKHMSAFDFVKLSHKGDTISRRQVLRFWKRDKGRRDPIITMTFLATSIGDGCNHEEFDTSMFTPTAHFATTLLNPLRNRSETDVVELRPNLAHAGENVRIKFESVQEARDFKIYFESTYRPAPQLDVPLPSSASISSASSQRTPSDANWQKTMPSKVDDLSIGQGYDESFWGPVFSDSRAPTLVTTKDVEDPIPGYNYLRGAIG